mgnify:CR=1 FL=1
MVFASAKVSIFASGLTTAITLPASYSKWSASNAIDAPAASANIGASVVLRKKLGALFRV